MKPKTLDDIKAEQAQFRDANTAILKSASFERACEDAHIKPGRRQASKFRRHRGAAYAHRTATATATTP